jgi:subtilisin-like proprotein convertase family protein/uncharacterized protein YegP (UPF0339 family)
MPEPGPLAQAQTSFVRKLRIRDRSLASRLDRLGGRVVSDYGSYLLYEVPEGIADDARRNAAVESVDEYRYVLLNSGPVDTTARRPRRFTRERLSGKGLRLVQFVGPTRPEWLSALRGTGVEVIAYVPHNAYLVYGDADAMGALTALDPSGFIQWQGAYRAEHKVHPRAFRAAALRALRDRPGSRQPEELYAVQLVGDPSANAETRALLRARSRGVVRGEFRVRNYLNLIVPLRSTDIDAVASRPDVVSIQPFVVPQKSDERQGQISAGNLTGSPGYLDFLAAAGFTQDQFASSGFAVDVSDSGIDNATALPNHAGLYVLGNRASGASRVAYNRLEGLALFGDTLEGCDGHGNINAHIIAGYNDGAGFPFADADGFHYGLGIAPFVKVGSSVIFAPNFTYPDFPDLQSRAYRDGARVSSNSWGGLVYGAYDVTAQTFDALVRDAQPAGAAVSTPGNQEMVIVVAAGNEGFDGLRSPATAKNVITVGASENVHFFGDLDGCGLDDSAADGADDIAEFSSRGPTEDGRLKPDLVAPGTHITGGVYQAASAGPTGEAHACFDGTSNCGMSSGLFFPEGQELYTTSSGTSHSTPAVAGGAALVRQHFLNQGMPAPSPAMTKAVLVNSARYLAGEGSGGSLWSTSQGMGGMNLGTAFDATPRVLRDQRPEDVFTASGETRVVTGTIADASFPFRVTLAWTDAPGSTAGPAFNNDLDLTVIVDGLAYKGNVFSGAWSVFGGGADLRNNVESVFLPAGAAGDFTVTVTAANVNSDGVPNVGGSLDQDFALVVYNGDEIARPAVVSAGATLRAEECGPGNSALDPGELVTVDFSLRNVGLADTTEVTASLEASGGVTVPSSPQSYGPLLAGGPAVARSFSFVADGVCGEELVATLVLEDGGPPAGVARFSFDLGTQAPSGLSTSLSNPASVFIPVGGPASPYPSSIEVGGLSGQVSQVRVGLHGITHPFPDDLDVLLVAPNGRGVVLLSDAGGGARLSGVDVSFDDEAASAVPDGGPIIAGEYRPSNYEGAADDFSEEAPSGPYFSTLGDLSGVDPNGTWRLYVVDDFFLDGGNIANGWSLTIETTVPICCGGLPGFLVKPAGGLRTTEAGGASTFTISLRSTPTDTVTIGIESSDTTEGTVSPAEIVFDPSDAQLPRVVTVTGVDDLLIDGDRPFEIVTSPALSSDSSYAGLDPEDVPVVNENDDLPSLSIGDAVLVEEDAGTTPLAFAVSLSAPAEYEVSVGYQTRDDRALAGVDYQPASGQLNFPAGTLTRTFEVLVIADDLLEADETFFVDLTGAQGALVSDGRATGTIRNDDLPVLSVNKTSAAMGEAVQVSLSSGPGNLLDWIVLVKPGTASTSYLDWKYLNDTRTPPASGLTSAVVTFAMPASPSSYEFRLLANNGYNLLATSPTVTVRGPTLAANPTSTMPGGAAVVTVTEGPGNRLDWVALAKVGSAPSSYLDWKYLSGTRTPPASGLTSAALTFAMPSTLGQYEFRFFANNALTLLATSPIVTVDPPTTPILEVAPASLAFGTVATGMSAQQTVTLKNAGVGTLVGEGSIAGAGFSIVGTGSYSLGAGATATLTVRFAPLAAGPASGTLTLTGASGASVPLSGTAVPGPTLTVSATSAPMGNPVSVAVANGLGNRNDWVALARVGTPSTSYLDWQYLNGTKSLPAAGLTSATLTFAIPQTMGDYEFRFFANGVQMAVSPVVSTRPPSVVPSATTVAPGGSVTVSVSDGPAYRGDWVALARVGSASTAWLDWKYLNGTRTMPASGVSSAVLTFTMPATLGQYELRFFANNGYTLLATSAIVTVAP